MFPSMRTVLFNLKQCVVSGGSEGTEGRAGQGQALAGGMRGQARVGLR